MSLETEIMIVSGLPRSGTSLMMQMLERGGIEVLTDLHRPADVDNPRGYYEFEPVRRTQQDKSWVPLARGKAVKVISQLLYELPEDERYRIVFMQREISEVVISQEEMLRRRNRMVSPRPQVVEALTVHLERLLGWLPQQPHMNLLVVSYHELLRDPPCQAQRVARFLAGRPEASGMIEAIDPGLHRQRKPA